jgi:general secretion pathway protein H
VGPQHRRGFTLIELLVVMVIIAIVASLAVISLNVVGRDPPAKRAAGELADLAGLAAEQAVMQGQEYGLRIEAHGYSFYAYDGRRWSPLQGDNLFYRRDLGDDVSLSLQLEGTPATLSPPPATVQSPEAATAAGAEDQSGSQTEQKDLPQVLLLSSGELPPFEIRVTGSSGAVYTVKGSFTDGITVIEPEEPQGGKPP